MSTKDQGYQTNSNHKVFGRKISNPTNTLLSSLLDEDQDDFIEDPLDQPVLSRYLSKIFCSGRKLALNSKGGWLYPFTAHA